MNKIRVFVILLLMILLIIACRENVSIVGENVIHCLEDCSQHSMPEKRPLKIITLNLYHGFPKFKYLQTRLDLLIQHIESNNVDIVFLQEVPWRKNAGLGAEYIAKELGFNYAYFRANGNYSLIKFEEGLTILSRFKLQNPRYHEIQPKPGWFENRAALAVTALTSEGKINLVTTHLSWDFDNNLNSQQIISLESFINSLENLPTIMAGDFNAVDTSPQIMKLKTNWVDAYKVVNNKNLPTCCLHRNNIDLQNPGKHRARVDYIFLSRVDPNWEILNAQLTLNRPVKLDDSYLWVSNHTGIIIDAQLRQKNNNF